MFRPIPLLTFLTGLAAGPFLVAAVHAHDAAHPGTAVSGPEADYLKANAAIMDVMMRDMDRPPAGDIDHDFVAMMVPHHQGAIDMAQALLRYGSNQTLKRLAQEIIVTQQQEIAAMRLALGEPLPPSAPSPTAIPPASPAAATPQHPHMHD